MNPFKHYGDLGFDLTDLIGAVKAIPKDAWVFRGDPESYKTSSVREGSPYLPLDLIEQLFTKVTKHLMPGYTNRVVLSLIPAGESILPHTDDFGDDIRSKSWHCHIPLITSKKVIMGFSDDKVEVNMKKGHLYSIDETRTHWVENRSKVDRVHLLFAWFPHKGKTTQEV